jgi:hypothetical protein
VLRLTYDLRENENRLAEWMEAKSKKSFAKWEQQNLARRTVTGVGSSHDFGGARMGADPKKP